MDIARVVIEDMPGPAWWEFLFQWAGLLVQCAAAGGTFAAVVLALRLARRDTAWKRIDEARRKDLIRSIIHAEIKHLSSGLVLAMAACDEVLAMDDEDQLPVGVKVGLGCPDPEINLNSTWRLLEHLPFLARGLRAPLSEIMALAPPVKQFLEIQQSDLKIGDRRDHTKRYKELCFELNNHCRSYLVVSSTEKVRSAQSSED